MKRISLQPLDRFLSNSIGLARNRRTLGAVLVLLLAPSGSRVIAEPLPSGILPSQVETRSYLSYAVETLDTLIQFGTDRYGSIQSDSILVGNLDVRTKQNVYQESDDELYHVERRERRAPGGTNFLHNQEVLRAMYHVSSVTGDNKYANFADNYMLYSMANHKRTTGPSAGMFWWGWHQHYDVHTDQLLSGDGDHHEIHATISPLWDRMYALNPTAVTTEIEKIWERHIINDTTGEYNRHDNNAVGRAFIFSGGAFIEAFSFMYEKTGDPKWQTRSNTVANFVWSFRNPTTNLIPDTPKSTDRFDGLASSTVLPGLYAPALYRGYELSGNTLLRDQALLFTTQWAQYAYDPDSGGFWGALNLNGTPVLGPRVLDGNLYEAYQARGLVDLWQPDLLAYEYPTETALAYAQFYAATGNESYRTTADQWAKLIREDLPAVHTLDEAFYQFYSQNWAPHGAYAAQYARVIEFFLTMFDTTDEGHYLLSARDVAKEAISRLWYEGLFRGHANKPYYEAVDGPGLLIDVLVKLDAHSSQFGLYGDFNHDLVVDTVDFEYVFQNWHSEVDAYANGDSNGDGFVDLDDFLRFKYELLLPGAQQSAAFGNSVPESSTIALVMVACGVGWKTGVLRCRRSAGNSRRNEI